MNQENKLEIKRSIVDLEKLNKIKFIKDDLTQECILLFDV
jgi:hypothetical protein